jgi:chorismate mutase
VDQQTDQPTVNGHRTLDDWRSQIDALDIELLRLLNQRAAIACEIASIKVASGLPATTAIENARCWPAWWKRTQARSTSKASPTFSPESSVRRVVSSRSGWRSRTEL